MRLNGTAFAIVLPANCEKSSRYMKRSDIVPKRRGGKFPSYYSECSVCRTDISAFVHAKGEEDEPRHAAISKMVIHLKSEHGVEMEDTPNR